MLRLCFVTIACGEFNTISGGETVTLMSPNFPKNYNNKEYCVYAVVCEQAGVRLTMNIVSFDIEQSAGCRKDYMFIQDGIRKNSTSLGNYCGSTIPKNPIVSSGPRLMVNFLTNNNVTKTGFNATVSCPGRILSNMAMQSFCASFRLVFLQL